MELLLGDLVSFASGNTPSKSNPEFWGGETPWISANAMHSPFLNDSELRLTKTAVLEKAKLCAEGDILLLVRGSGLHSRLPVGVAEIPLAFNQDVKAIRSVDDRLDQQYLFYWFRGNQDFLLESVEYTGIGAGKLDTDFLKKITLNLPCLSEQHSIAHIGRCLDRKIELNQKMNQTLEEIAKAIFKSWFVDFDPVRAKAEGRPTGLPPEISDLFPDEFVDSEIGQIPKGWSQESIYQFCSVEYGAPFKSKLFNEDGQGIPLVRIRDLPKGKSGVFTEEVHPKGTLIKAGDLVVGMDGEFRCYLWRGIDSWMNQRVCKFVPKENVPSTFIWFALERPLHFIESTEVATTVIHLGKGDIDDFQFIQSSQELLDQFSKFTSPLLERMVIASKEIEILAELRDTLLPKLISGELRIPEAEKFLEEAGI